MTRFRIALFLFVPAFCWSAYAQVSAYKLPKYPEKMKAFVRETGPKPGTKAQEGQSATFTRVTFLPAELRIVARANCGTTPGKGGLIGRARDYSEAHGQVVEVDWEPVRTKKPGFWAVMEAKKTTLTINLREEDGFFVITNKQSKEQSQWHTAPLIFNNGLRCVEEETLTAPEMRKAIKNILNTITIQHYRNNPGS